MWAIVAVTLHMLVGPHAGVVLKAGTFDNKASCEAAIKDHVPAKLDEKYKKLYEAGSAQYVCLKVIEGDA